MTLIDNLRGQLSFIRRNVTTQSAVLERTVLPGIHYVKVRSYLSSYFVNYQFTTSFITAPEATKVDSRQR